MDEPPPGQEQLRRLKNTVMGASQRLQQMSQSGEWHGGAAAELAEITRTLDEAVSRLERLLAVLRRDGQRIGLQNSEDSGGGTDRQDQAGRGGGE